MDRWTEDQIDDGQKVVTLAHPEHSSGEQINKRAITAHVRLT